MPSFEEDNDPSSQLQATLLESTKRIPRRPLLTHVNADTTWLLSLPLPNENRERSYYHILIDPWLKGGQSDVAKFFSQQWHATPSSCQTIADVENVIKGIEEGTVADKLATEDAGNNTAPEPRSYIDVVAVSHEFTDHMHKETLLEIAKTVPIFASTKAAGIIKSWKHFSTVIEIPRFNKDWRASSIGPLPKWLGISRVAYAGTDMLYYHSAVMVAFSANEANSDAEAVIYTPHGVSPQDAAPIAEAEPQIQTLALLHGLQDIKLPKAQLNKGAHNGLKVQRLLKSKYWIGTHDEVKKGGGLVSFFLKRKMITLKDAIEKERQDENGSLEGNDLESMQDVRFEEVGNGERLILA